MQYLSKNELRKINGGHKGEAYEAGRTVGKVIKFAAFLIPGVRYLRKVL